jgi:hypothetical protein
MNAEPMKGQVAASAIPPEELEAFTQKLIAAM